MDPDLVRLILVLLGVALVVGIYLWDRYKRAAPRVRRVRRAPGVAAGFQRGMAESENGTRREPTVGDDVESIPEVPMDDAPDATDRQPPRRASSAIDPEPADLGDWSAGGRDDDPPFAMELNFDAHGDADYLHTDPALRDEVERLIVVINLVGSKAPISGTALEKACASVGLEPGEMAIYHRSEPGSNKVLFSMASMVEPGSFPFDDMSGFTTPGLSLFTQLPGARDGITIYNEMLAAAERLGSLLKAELQDERHNKLTRQMQEHTRATIVEHRRRIQLARSRR